MGGRGGSPPRAHWWGCRGYSTCNRDCVCPHDVSQGRCLVCAARKGCVSPLSMGGGGVGVGGSPGKDCVSQTWLSTGRLTSSPSERMLPRAGLSLRFSQKTDCRRGLEGRALFPSPTRGCLLEGLKLSVRQGTPTRGLTLLQLSPIRSCLGLPWPPLAIFLGSQSSGWREAARPMGRAEA